MSNPNIREVVREKYGQAARRVTSGAGVVAAATLPRWKPLVIR